MACDGCPSPYQFEGAHSPSDLPRGLFPLIPLPVKVIRWEVDNMTALAYVRKEGGTSLPLLQVASEVLLLADSFQIKILPVYVPSVQNLHADFASRFKELPDLHLLPAVFQRMCNRWGIPEIDLFASPDSHQLPRFFAWGSSMTPEAFDTLSHLWAFDLTYLFPRFRSSLASSTSCSSCRGSSFW